MSRATSADTAVAAPSAVERQSGQASRATISDVAAAAGVSRATVSRVMNGRSTVDPELADRVHQAARDLAYRPNSVARSLSLGRTLSVAVLIPELDNPMFQRVLQGFTAASAPAGYRVLVANTGDDPAAEVAAAVEARHRCDAIMLVAPRSDDEALTSVLRDLRPAVVVGRPPSAAVDVPSLSIDYAAGVGLAVDHLVQLGHTDLLYLAGPSVSSSNRRRVEGLHAAVKRYKGKVSVTELAAGAHLDDGHRSAAAVAEAPQTAVIAYNDLVAFGLGVGLAELGVSVPGQKSIVGFDDIELARYAAPPLTTLAVPHAELGSRAWTHLAAVLAGEDGPDATPYVPELVVRGSTGPAA